MPHPGLKNIHLAGISLGFSHSDTQRAGEKNFPCSTAQSGLPKVYHDLYLDFFTSKPAEAALDIIEKKGKLDPPESARLLFDSGSGWKLYRSAKADIFHFTPPEPLSICKQLVVFDKDWTKGTFYAPRSGARGGASNHSNHPLGFPFIEVWLTGLLGKGRGLLLHACGVLDHERGYLLLGEQEVGKSTLACLWHPQAQVLSDERVILREQDGHPWVFGTPWHSNFNVFSPLGAPLEKVFFIRHARQPGHNAVRLDPIEAATRMLKNAILPIWDRASMDFSLGLVGRVCENIPCWDLAFSPDESVLEYIRCVS